MPSSMRSYSRSRRARSAGTFATTRSAARATRGSSRWSFAAMSAMSITPPVLRGAGPVPAPAWPEARPASSAVRVEPGVDLPGAPVQVDELAELPVVHVARRGLRPERPGDGDAVGDLVPRQVPQRDRRLERGTARVRHHRVLHLEDGPVHDVRHDLAPQLGAGPATDDRDGVEPPLDELLDVPEQPPAVVGHALQHRPDQMPPRCAEGLVEEAAPGGPVV